MRLWANPVWLRMSGSDAAVTKPGSASQTAGTALRICMAVATLAECTCSAMDASRVKLARVTKWEIGRAHV